MKRPNIHQYATLNHQPSASNAADLEEAEEAPILVRSPSHSQQSQSIRQTSLNLDAITSKKSRNSTLFTITQVGTKSSRSGLYIRPLFRVTLLQHFQNRIKTYIVIVVILLSLRPLHLFAKNDQQGHQASEDDDVISFSSDGYKSLSPTKEMKNIQDMCSSTSAASTVDSNTKRSCACLNPLDGKKGIYPGWERAYEMNLQMVDENYTSNGKKFDLVFLGDSIVEEWNGRWLGREGKEFNDINGVWEDLFDPAVTSGAMKALALGIAGDQIANLLWRIQHGELEHVDSKVFWILIGTNDLTQRCSEDVILLGIIHIVEQIKELKPDSIIVLNGLLPRTNDQSGKLINSQDGEVTLPTSINKVEDDHAKIFNYDSLEVDDGNMMNQTESNMKPSTDANSLSSEENAVDPPTTKQTSIEQTNSSPSSTSISSHHNFWQSIQSINKGLASYAEQHDRVEYFDASDIFVAHLGNKYHQRSEDFLMKELQGDLLHPTALGHKLWGEAIVDYIISDLDLPPSLLRGFAD